MRIFSLSLFLSFLLVAPTQGQETAQDWEMKLEETISAVQDRWRVPGAAAAIVDGDEIIAAGFGLADTDNDRPVTAETPFYLASSGKLFTALAALQLVQSGRIELHQAIESYIPQFKIQTGNEFGTTTLHHLLTHTAGFDDRLIGYAARSLDERRSLRQYLDERMPPQVRPPGKLIGYSNHGFGLVGLAIEAVSGRSFEDFVTEELLQPLGMEGTAYPPMPETGAAIAHSYNWSGERRALGYSNVVPAGGIASSANDMARLMQAILSPESDVIPASMAQSMMSPQAAHHPELAARGYSLWEHRFGTHTGWVIGGSAYGYSSALILIPERRLGAAVMLNRQEPGQALALVEQWIEWRLKTEEANPVPVAMRDIADLEGTYRWIRHGSRSVESIAGHFMEVVLEATSESTLIMRGPGADGKWLHMGDGVFSKESDPSLRLAFDQLQPRPHYLFSNHLLTMPTAFESVPPWDTALARAMQLGVFVIIAILALLVFAAFAWRDRRRTAAKSTARGPGVLLSLAMLFFIPLVALSLRNFAENLAYGPNLWLRLSTLWPLVITLAWFAFGYRVVATWHRQGLASRIGYLWLLAAALGLLVLTVRYHWWGWSF